MERKVDIIGSTVVEQYGKILLVQEAKDVFSGVKGKWNLPTGKIEPKEDVQTCALRETKEESGLNVEIEYLIGVYQYHKEFTDKLIDVLRFAYKAKISGGEIKKTEEVSDVKWFSLDEIREMGGSNLLRSEEVLLVAEDYFKGKKLSNDTLTIIK